MFAASKLLLDHKISRRAFISRLSQAGMTVAGATTIANALGTKTVHAAGNGTTREKGRVVENMTGGEVMAEFLMDWDIPYVFGLAGSEEVGFLDALVDRTRLQYATCLHEGAAMAMADGYSRSTGRTTIVQLHSIAGAAYALGQLVGSYRDRIPVVVTTGRQSVDFRGQDGFLEAENLHELPRDYVQWVWDVMSAETIPEVLRRAFLLAEAPPGGPTFVTFSKDLWEMNIRKTELLPRSRSMVSTDVVPSESHVKAITDNLLQGQFPVMFLGNECIRHEISDEVAGIAEAIGAMVMTANKIPVVFPNTHPNFGGQFLIDGNYLMKDIDTFWSLGGPMFKLSGRPARPLISRDATIMHTSLVEADVGRNYPVDIATIASIKATTAAVLEELQQRNLKTSVIRDRKRWLGTHNTQRRKAIDARAKKEWNSRPISVTRLMMELNTAISPDGYVVSEVVTGENHLRNYLEFDHTRPVATRRRNFDTTSGILGWGLPASIGVKMGNPDKEVWCLTADGCFNFGVQALWSAARYEVPIGIVVFNNGQYQANRLNQNRYHRRMTETGKYIGVNLKHPAIGYTKIGEAYGIEGERVEEPDKLAAALKRCRKAIQDGRPYLVDVVVATFGQGHDSEWYDYFSIAKNQARIS